MIYAVLCQMNRSDVSMSSSVSPNVSRWGGVGSHWKGLEVEGYEFRNGKVDFEHVFLVDFRCSSSSMWLSMTF